MLGLIYLIHITFVIPVSMYSPGSSRLRLWFGWWIGWLIGMLMMAGALILTSHFLPNQSFKIDF